VGLVGALAGPSVYAIVTIGQPHEGGGPSVGPADASRQGHFWFGQGADNPDLDAILKDTNTKWSAAILRSSSAAGLELSTDTAVMAIGGFSGSDPAPTLSQFQGRRGAAQGGLLRRHEQPWPRAGLGQPRSRRHRQMGCGDLLGY
jgi:hypothetical protein